MIDKLFRNRNIDDDTEIQNESLEKFKKLKGNLESEKKT